MSADVLVNGGKWEVHRSDRKGGYSMGRTQTQREIEQLKGQLKASYRESDFRLLKMVLVLIILAVVAGLIYGKIQLF